MEEVKKVSLLLRKKGYVLSMPRIAIIKYLLSNKTHHTAESIYRAISKEYPSISLATVYNTLKILAKEGFVIQLAIEGDRLFYDSTLEEHSHFVCKICGKIKDVPTTKPKKIKNIDDDRIERVHVYFYGVCRECIEKEKVREKKHSR